MNKLNRIITSLVFLFSIVPVWPLVAMDDCLMPCCQETNSHCGTTNNCPQCSMSIGDCHRTIVFLVISPQPISTKISQLKSCYTLMIYGMNFSDVSTLHLDNPNSLSVDFSKIPRFFLYHSLLI